MHNSLSKLMIATSTLTSTISFSAPDARVFYRIFGEEHQETVALIHGFNSTHTTWNKLVPHLAKSFRVIVYDQPGHGESKTDAENFSPSEMAKELKLLFEALDISNAHVIGHSMGGRTAIAFASEYPALVKSVAIEDMGIQSVPESIVALPRFHKNFQAIRANVPDKHSGVISASISLSKYFTVEETIWLLAASKRELDGSITLGNRPEATALYLHQGLAEDLSSKLQSIGSPLIFMAGDPADSTTVLTPAHIEKIKQVRPDVKVKIFSGAGHKIHSRSDFAHEIMSFLSATKHHRTQHSFN